MGKSNYRHWACLDCLSCHVSFDPDPKHFNATGREHIADFGHRIEGKQVVNGEVVLTGVWAPKANG